MIHVVVAVLAVTADTVQITEGIKVFHELRHAVVRVEVGRIRLLHALTMGIDHVLRAVDDLHAGELLDGELLRLLLRHVPEGITLLAEVFKADPHGVVNILDQIRAPVVEDLQAADLIARILHVNPTIRHDRRIAKGGNVGGVRQAQMIDEQTDGHEITVRQAVGDFGHILRRGLARSIHSVDEVLDRHGRNEVVRSHFGTIAFGILIHHGSDLAVGLANLHHVRVGNDLHASRLTVGLDGFPQLTRTILRIPEFLNQRGFDLSIATLLRQELLERVLQHAHNAQALDALRTPIGGNLGRMATPQLLGVALEEHGIQLAAETIDVEVLQIVFRQLVHHGLQIAETGNQRKLRAHGLQRVGAQGNRVVKEVAVPVNTRHAMTLEHHLVFDFRIRSARFHIVLTTELLVIIAWRALQRQDPLPPIHDAFVLREETMATNIHTVAIMLDGAGDAAEFAGRFQHGHVVVLGATVLDELPSGGQACRATADNHHGLLLRHFEVSL